MAAFAVKNIYLSMYIGLQSKQLQGCIFVQTQEREEGKKLVKRRQHRTKIACAVCVICVGGCVRFIFVMQAKLQKCVHLIPPLGKM